MSQIQLKLLCLSFVVFFSACSDDENNGSNQFDVPGASDVTYKVSFISNWSQSSHPNNFPSNAHFSGLVGATHNASVSFWSDTTLASDGIKAMAELGQQSGLNSEVDIAISQKNADKVILGNGLPTSPNSLSFTLPMQTSFPLVTLVSMLAPSPDWFVGVNGINLYENNVWIDNLTVELFAYDSGTDSGTTYSSGDIATIPAVPIQKISNSPFLVSGNIVPVGQFVFTLQ